MKIQIKAKTINEAVDTALIKLDCAIDEIEYNIIQEPSKGFLGIGNKMAIIEVWNKKDTEKILAEEAALRQQQESEKTKIKESKSKKVTNNVSDIQKNTPIETENFTSSEDDSEDRLSKPINENCAKIAESFLKELLQAMNVQADITTDFVNNKQLNIDIKSKDMGVLIGKRGQTLYSIQYLLNLVVNKGEYAYVSVNLDVEDYKARRKETLENLAVNLARKAKSIRRNVVLEPMNPYERRIIHSTLQNDKYVSTHSEGEEPYRYVVISPKKHY